jgi:hypothetical protein
MPTLIFGIFARIIPKIDIPLIMPLYVTQYKYATADVKILTTEIMFN